MREYIFASLVIGSVALAGVIFALMVNYGPTLSNRCEWAFPDISYIDKERCVDHLFNNGKIWEFKPSEVK